MKTVIRFSGTGGELDKIVLDDDDATTEAIAAAAVALIQRSGMSMSEGDVITVTAEG